MSEHENWPVWEFTGEYNDEGGHYRTLIRAKPELKDYQQVIDAFQAAAIEGILSKPVAEVAKANWYEDRFRVGDIEDLVSDELQLKHGILIIPELPTLDGGEQYDLHIDLDDERLDGIRDEYNAATDAYHKDLEARYGKR